MFADYELCLLSFSAPQRLFSPWCGHVRYGSTLRTLKTYINDAEVVIIRQSVNQCFDGKLSNLSRHSVHTATRVNQDDHIFRRTGAKNVPTGNEDKTGIRLSFNCAQ